MSDSSLAELAAACSISLRQVLPCSRSPPGALLDQGVEQLATSCRSTSGSSARSSMITLRMLLAIVSATASGSFLIPSGSLSMAPAPSSTISSTRPVSSKSATISDGVGLDVGVEQVAHAGLVLLEVDVLAGAELDLVADGRVVRDLLP